MIVGVGLDLVEIAHFRRIIQKGGVVFYKKILTPQEFKEVSALSPVAQVSYGAKRYAVKEAFAKACGGRGSGSRRTCPSSPTTERTCAGIWKPA